MGMKIRLMVMKIKQRRRLWILLPVLLTALGVIGYYLIGHRAVPERVISFSDLLAEIRHDNISTLLVSGQEVTAHRKNDKQILRAIMPAAYPDLIPLTEQHHVEVVYRLLQDRWSWVGNTIGPTLQVLTLLLLAWLFFGLRSASAPTSNKFIWVWLFWNDAPRLGI
jgi:hypothetical protein